MGTMNHGKRREEEKEREGEGEERGTPGAQGAFVQLASPTTKWIFSRGRD